MRWTRAKRVLDFVFALSDRKGDGGLSLPCPSLAGDENVENALDEEAAHFWIASNVIHWTVREKERQCFWALSLMTGAIDWGEDAPDKDEAYTSVVIVLLTQERQ
jgi:hypothetical protein